MNTNTKYHIKPILLIRIWNKIKSDPLKVWLKSDFGTGYYSLEKHLHTLVRMDLIEIVPAVYVIRGKLVEGRAVRGYKLLRKAVIEN